MDTQDSETLIASKYSEYPVLGLPSNLHGVNAHFKKNSLGLVSFQTYSQKARYANLLNGHVKNDSYLDVSGKRQACIIQMTNLSLFFNKLGDTKSVGFRTEMGFSVLNFTFESIAITLEKALRYKMKNVILFDTSDLLEFSYLWASTTFHLKLLAIDCLSNRFSSVEDRQTHHMLDTLIDGLIGKFFKGFSGVVVAQRFFEAYKILNFLLLPKPSTAMTKKLSLTLPSVYEAQTLSPSSSENFHAAVIIYYILIYIFFINYYPLNFFFKFKSRSSYYCFSRLELKNIWRHLTRYVHILNVLRAKIFLFARMSSMII